MKIKFTWRKSRFFLEAALLSSLACACGNGTDVGNALTSADIEMTSESGQASSSASSLNAMRALNALDTDSGLTVAQFNIRRLSLPPQSSCASLPAVLSWLRSSDDTFFDWFNSGSVPLPVSIPFGFTTCQIRFLIGPPKGSSSGNSIDVEGVTPGGRPFTVRSSSYHILALTSPVPIEISQASGQLIQSVLFRSKFASLLALDDGGSGEIDITPDGTPIQFRFFMKELRAIAQGYRFQRDASGNIVRDTGASLVQGDDSQDQPVSGEAY